MAEVLPLEPVEVIYCEKCGMPPEYCEYGPDFETVCNLFLKNKYPELHAKLLSLGKHPKDNRKVTDESIDEAENFVLKPDAPWTTEERLVKFYEMYVPEKISNVPELLNKYSGKEEKLFSALVKKYGPEPEDPYFMDEEGRDEDDEPDELAKDFEDNVQLGSKTKRRGVKAKTSVKSETRVLIQKIIRSRKKTTTVVVGMESVEGIKLKDVSKAFSKRFAGSSSVKDGPKGKEIIIQGDHMEDVAEMIAKTFHVPGSSVFLDFDGEFVPYK